MCWERKKTSYMDSDHDFDCIPLRFRGLLANLPSEQLVARLHVMWLDTKLKDEVHEEEVTKTHSNAAETWLLLPNSS